MRDWKIRIKPSPKRTHPFRQSTKSFASSMLQVYTTAGAGSWSLYEYATSAASASTGCLEEDVSMLVGVVAALDRCASKAGFPNGKASEPVFALNALVVRTSLDFAGGFESVYELDAP